MAHRTQEQLRQIFEKIVELSATVDTIEGQATVIGVTTNQLYLLRNKAKKRGYEVGRVKQAQDRREEQDEPQLSKVEASMAGLPCDTCGLRGPHQCLSIASLTEIKQDGDGVFHRPRPRMAAP